MSLRKVRCLSLWQPWASLMACGAKFVETRDWDTKKRGEIFIHAAKTMEGYEGLRFAATDVIEAIEDALHLKMGRWCAELPLGAVIGAGSLAWTMTAEAALAMFPAQEPFGNFGPGRFGYVYADLREITPIPFKGAQGFFFAEISTEAQPIEQPFRLE